MGILPHFRRCDHHDPSPWAGGNDVLTILGQPHVRSMRPWESLARRGGGQPAQRGGSTLKRPAPPAKGQREQAGGGGLMPGPRSWEALTRRARLAPTRAGKAGNPAGLGFVRILLRHGPRLRWGLAPLRWLQFSGRLGFAAARVRSDLRTPRAATGSVGCAVGVLSHFRRCGYHDLKLAQISLAQFILRVSPRRADSAGWGWTTPVNVSS
jgi:hypothetical protein